MPHKPYTHTCQASKRAAKPCVVLAQTAQLPRIRMIAAAYLAGHTSTALQEQKFSYAGLNDTAKRHLSPSAQKDLMMCAANRTWLPPYPRGAEAQACLGSCF